VKSILPSPRTRKTCSIDTAGGATGRIVRAEVLEFFLGRTARDLPRKPPPKLLFFIAVYRLKIVGMSACKYCRPSMEICNMAEKLTEESIVAARASCQK
jgi:hypothetical protein